MTILHNLSIRSKLVAIVSLSMLFVLLIVGFSFLAFEMNNLRTVMSQMLTVRAEILSDNLSAAVMFDDLATAEETLIALKKDPHLVGAWVHKRDKSLFARYDRDPIHPAIIPPMVQMSESRFENGNLFVTRPISVGGKLLGSLTLESDLIGLRAVMIRAAVIIGTILLISLFIGIIISVKTQQMISEPISELVQMARRVSAEKNYSLRTPWSYGQNELGLLAEALNNMLGQIALQNDQLTHMNEELEKRINERTKAIQDTQQFLNSIVENIPNMIFIKEAERLRFTFLNRAGEELLGLPRMDIIEKNDYDFFPKKEADFFTQKDREVLKSGKMSEITEEPISTKKGIRFLHTKKVPMYDGQGKPQYLLGISEDITKAKLSQQELLQKTEELTRSRTELEQLELFAFAATHDLQEPLRAIHFYTDILKSQISGQLQEEQLLHFSRIQAAAARMAMMMEQMRELSRIGTSQSQFVKVDLNTIVEEVTQALELLIRENGAQIHVKVLPSILGDPTQMQQLLQNLIANAVKFKRKDGPAPVVKIEGRLVDGDRVAEITVEDNGIGFDEKYLDRIFKPFQRLHGKNEFPGSGLGLAISRKIVIRHSGKITAQSTVGQGAKFVIQLPAYSDRIVV